MNIPLAVLPTFPAFVATLDLAPPANPYQWAERLGGWAVVIFLIVLWNRKDERREVDRRKDREKTLAALAAATQALLDQREAHEATMRTLERIGERQVEIVKDVEVVKVQTAP